MQTVFILVPLFAAILFFIILPRLRKRRRQSVLKISTPPEWDAILKMNMPHFSRLPRSYQDPLKKLMQIFIHEKGFEGVGGLELTEEIKVTIAAQACLLLVGNLGDKNLDTYKVYTGLSSVVIYPSTFIGTRINSQGVKEKGVPTLGESWQHGTVILAWDAALMGGVNPFDGKNVTIHEFAHQLDQEDGTADGTPRLTTRAAYQPWARYFSEAYLDLIDRTERGKKTVINSYGATHEAEFFAVATETFFEKPKQLEKKRPELYQQLKNYFGLDPLNWK